MSDDEVQVKFSADITNLSQQMDVVTSKTRGYSQSLMKALADADNAGTKSLKNLGDAADGVSFKTAGATREFIVLGHEVMSGNFSRIPGSMVVLAERMGGLHSLIASITPATLGWAAA